MMASSLSRKLLIASFALLVLLFFGFGGVMTAHLALWPVQVFPGLEFWRLLTYPLGMGWLGLLMAMVAFSIPGEELENMLGRRTYGLLLLAMTFVLALVHMTAFYTMNAPLAGAGNLGLFVIVGYVYLFPQSELMLLFIRMRAWVLVAIFATLVLVLRVAYAKTALDVLLVFPDGWFGLLAGAAYFHARFQKYPFLLGPIRSMERAVTFNRYGREPAAQPAARRAPSPGTRARVQLPKVQVHEVSDEERLNMILEKISEKSYNALSEEEKAFLRDYSGRIE